MKLDQFFTKPAIAAECWKVLQRRLKKITGGNPGDFLYVEPSAGDGVFYDLLPDGSRLGMDIAPRRDNFIKCDFLEWNPSSIHTPSENIVVVGNPPFGKRGVMALNFFQTAAKFADTVAFIVPVIFRKYFIHKRMPADWQWVGGCPLPRDSFWTPAQESYRVNTEFQVWTNVANRLKNLRLFKPPPISHNDFQIWQYNNTKEALKVFNNKFDFAVPCQGWQDYTRRETSQKKCESHKQWMLFKTSNNEVYKRIHNEIDYEKLATENTTSVPGFRKGDIVQEYSSRYE